MGLSSKTAVLLIALWSLLVHVPGLLSPLRDYQAYRQTQTASMARNYVRHGMRFLNPELDTSGPHVRAGTEFPLYSYLLAMAQRRLGPFDWLGRMLSAFCALGGTLFFFFFVKRRMGQDTAFWSALALSSLPIHIFFTRTVQPEPLALLGLLGFLYFADHWLNVAAHPAAYLLAVAFGALAPLLKLPYLYLIAPLWLALGVERYQRDVVTQKAWWAMILSILILTQAWYAYAKTAQVIILPLTMKSHIVNLSASLHPGLWQSQFISRIPELVLTYSGLFFVIVAWKRLRSSPSAFLWACWLAASVLYVPLLGEYGLIHRYTLLPLAPLAALAIGTGMNELIISWSGARRRMWLAAVLIVGIPIHAAGRIAHWYKLDYPYAPALQERMSAISDPQDLVLVATHDEPILLYHMDRVGYAVDPASWTPEKVDSLLERGIRWIVIPLEDNPRRMPEWRMYLQGKASLVEANQYYWIYRIVGSTARLRQG